MAKNIAQCTKFWWKYCTLSKKLDNVQLIAHFLYCAMFGPLLHIILKTSNNVQLIAHNFHFFYWLHIIIAQSLFIAHKKFLLHKVIAQNFVFPTTTLHHPTWTPHAWGTVLTTLLVLFRSWPPHLTTPLDYPTLKGQI